MKYSHIQDCIFHQPIENNERTLYFYSTNTPKNKLSLKILHEVSSESTEPVGLINAKFEHVFGSQNPIFGHFDRKSIVLSIFYV